MNSNYSLNPLDLVKTHAIPTIFQLRSFSHGYSINQSTDKSVIESIKQQYSRIVLLLHFHKSSYHDRSFYDRIGLSPKLGYMAPECVLVLSFITKDFTE